MPIYEYLCKSCGRASSHLLSISSPPPPCPYCGGEMEKLISRFSFHKSIKTIWEESGEPEDAHKNPDYYRDPRNIGRWVEKKFKEMGMEVPGKVREMIDAAREGELPEPVKDL